MSSMEFMTGRLDSNPCLTTAAFTCLPKIPDPIDAQALAAIEKLKRLNAPSSCLLARNYVVQY